MGAFLIVVNIFYRTLFQKKYNVFNSALGKVFKH